MLVAAHPKKDGRKEGRKEGRQAGRKAGTTRLETNIHILFSWFFFVLLQHRDDTQQSKTG
jgi:hypothetical protein